MTTQEFKEWMETRCTECIRVFQEKGLEAAFSHILGSNEALEAAHPGQRMGATVSREVFAMLLGSRPPPPPSSVTVAARLLERRDITKEEFYDIVDPPLTPRLRALVDAEWKSLQSNRSTEGGSK